MRVLTGLSAHLTPRTQVKPFKDLYTDLSSELLWPPGPGSPLVWCGSRRAVSPPPHWKKREVAIILPTVLFRESLHGINVPKD